jgi:hypothetical protein
VWPVGTEEANTEVEATLEVGRAEEQPTTGLEVLRERSCEFNSRAHMSAPFA